MGATLTIPNQITNVHATAGTFAPYNAANIIGSTAPTLPMPDTRPLIKAYKKKMERKHRNDGGFLGLGKIFGADFLRILQIAITVIVAFWAPEFLELTKGFWAGFTGGALGSLAGQTFGMASGLQDSIQWGAVAAAGLTAGIIRGLEGVEGGFLKEMKGLQGVEAMQQAAYRGVIGQGVNVLTGQQQTFNWTAIAAGALAAPLTQGIDKELGSVENGRVYGAIRLPTNGTAFSAGALAGEFLKATTRQAMTILVNQGGRLDWTSVAVNAFGDALGNSIVGEMKRSGEEERRQKQWDAVLETARKNPQFDRTASGDQARGIYGLEFSGYDFPTAPAAEISPAPIPRNQDGSVSSTAGFIKDVYGRLETGLEVTPEERVLLRASLKSAGYDVGRSDFDVSAAAGRFVYSDERVNEARLDFNARTHFYTNYAREGNGEGRYTYAVGADKTVAVQFADNAANIAHDNGYTRDYALIEHTDHRVYEALINGMMSTSGIASVMLSGASRPGEVNADGKLTPHGAGLGLDLHSVTGMDGRESLYNVDRTESRLLQQFNDNLWSQRYSTGLTQLIGPHRYAMSRDQSKLKDSLFVGKDSKVLLEHKTHGHLSFQPWSPPRGNP